MPPTTEEVWAGFRGRLYSYIRARSRSAQDADDILQDVFVKVHRRLGTLADEDRIAPWLFRLTHNTIIDHYRRVQPVPTPEITVVAEDAEDAPIAEQRLAPFLSLLIEDLPPIYREAITLTEIDGLTQVELGRRLGLSTSGAKSRVQRGRAMLRDQLLECCHFETDRRGNVIDFSSRTSEPWPQACVCAPQSESFVPLAEPQKRERPRPC